MLWSARGEGKVEDVGDVEDNSKMFLKGASRARAQRLVSDRCWPGLCLGGVVGQRAKLKVTVSLNHLPPQCKQQAEINTGPQHSMFPTEQLWVRVRWVSINVAGRIEKDASVEAPGWCTLRIETPGLGIWLCVKAWQPAVGCAEFLPATLPRGGPVLTVH